MKLKYVLAIALLAFSLAGCFTSDEPLLGDDKAVAPYARITFKEGDDDEINALVREGKAYVVQGGDTRLAMRFMPLDGDWYVVEATGERDGEVQRLYALMKLDLAAGIAETYKSVAEEGDIGPGFEKCSDGMVCIASLDAYVAHARAAVAAGAKADATYEITVE